MNMLERSALYRYRADTIMGGRDDGRKPRQSFEVELWSLAAREAALVSVERPAQNCATGMQPRAPFDIFDWAHRLEDEEHAIGRVAGARILRINDAILTTVRATVGARSKRFTTPTGVKAVGIGANGLVFASAPSFRGHRIGNPLMMGPPLTILVVTMGTMRRGMGLVIERIQHLLVEPKAVWPLVLPVATIWFNTAWIGTSRARWLGTNSDRAGSMLVQAAVNRRRCWRRLDRPIGTSKE